MRILSIAMMAPMLLLLAGCGGPRIVPVKGVVTHAGQPIHARLVLYFFPDNGGPPSSGTTDAKGRFELRVSKDTKGAVAGKHKVVVKFRPKDAKEETEFLSGTAKLHPDQEAILEKYGKLESTALEVEITPGMQEITLKLD